MVTRTMQRGLREHRWPHRSRRISTLWSGIDRRANSGSQIVAMMQTAEPGHGYDSGTCFEIRLCATTGRSSLRQGQMCPIVVVVTDVFIHQTFQMPFIHDGYVVEQISAAVADPALCDTVLPRTSEAGPLGLDAEAFHCGDHFFIEACTAIEDQIGGSRIEGESLTQLLNDPGGGRMFGHIAVKDLAPVMRNHEEAVKDAEVQRGHCEEVHCGEGFAVIGQK